MRTPRQIFEDWCDLSLRDRAEVMRLIKDHTKFTRNLDAIVDALNKYGPEAVEKSLCGDFKGAKAALRSHMLKAK